MKIKVFKTNNNGKIEFTQTELENLLNEIYKSGYVEGEAEGRKNNFTWTSPSISTIPCYNTPYYNTITTDTTNTTNTTNTINPSAADTSAISTSSSAIHDSITTATAATTAIDNSIVTESVDKVSTAKETNPTYTIKVNSTDISKMVNDIFGVTRPEDAFSKLTKELNF